MNPLKTDDPALTATMFIIAICVGIDFGAISSVTRLPDHADNREFYKNWAQNCISHKSDP